MLANKRSKFDLGASPGSVALSGDFGCLLRSFLCRFSGEWLGGTVEWVCEAQWPGAKWGGFSGTPCMMNVLDGS